MKRLYKAIIIGLIFAFLGIWFSGSAKITDANGIVLLLKADGTLSTQGPGEPIYDFNTGGSLWIILGILAFLMEFRYGTPDETYEKKIK